MSLLRLLRTTACALSCLAVIAVTPAFADEPSPAALPQTCGGVDVLEEAKSKDPSLYQTVTNEAKAIANSEALLWKIEKSGAAPSYLMGTIHVSDPRVTALPAKMKDAFAGSKTVALEFVGGEAAAGAALMAGAGQQLIYTDGKTLDGQLTSEEFTKVKALIAKSGMPDELAGILRPWIVNMLLAISDCERSKMVSGAKALDTVIENEASAAGKTLAGLETPEQQLNALTAIPETEQIQMLKAGLHYADRANDMQETLVQMYLKRQISAAMPLQIAMAAKVGTPASAYDGFVKLLLTDRNARMAQAMTPLIDKGGAFVAVGALHLPGAKGLVALLREAGYTVTAVE